MTTPDFRPDRLAALAAAEVDHPWFVARRMMVAGLVERVRPAGPARILDVGCGTGRTLADLARESDEATGVDLLASQSHRLGGRDDLVEADVRDLPFTADTADVVLALDVLEHVVEDEDAIAELVRVTRSGGHLVVTVPCHPWLWSRRDEDAGHVRRYTRRGFVGVLQRSGLVVEQVAWFAGTTLPALVVLRLLGRLVPGLRDVEERPRRGWAARPLHRALTAEARAVVSGGGPVMGSSLVAVARVP